MFNTTILSNQNQADEQLQRLSTVNQNRTQTTKGYDDATSIQRKLRKEKDMKTKVKRMLVLVVVVIVEVVVMIMG